MDLVGVEATLSAGATLAFRDCGASILRGYPSREVAFQGRLLSCLLYLTSTPTTRDTGGLLGEELCDLQLCCVLIISRKGTGIIG